MSFFEKLFKKKEKALPPSYLQLFSVKEELIQFNSFSAKKMNAGEISIDYYKTLNQAQNNFFQTFSQPISIKNANKKINVSLFAIANKVWTVNQKKQVYLLMKQILWNTLDKDSEFQKDVFLSITNPKPVNCILAKYGMDPKKRDFLYIFDLLNNIKVYRKNMRDIIKSELCTYTEFDNKHIIDLTVARILNLEHAQFDYYVNISKNHTPKNDFLETCLKDFNWFNFAFRLEEPLLNMLEINNIDFYSLEKIVYIDSKSGICKAPHPEKYNSCPLNFTEFNILQGNMTVNQWLYDHNYRNISNAEKLLSQYQVENIYISMYQKNLITYQHKFLSDNNNLHVSKRNVNRL